MSDGLGMIIECLVAVLLMLTIGYCMLLNRRLKLLRADENALRVTIGELITATEIAERAIAGLKAAARECESGLGERLAHGERLAADLDRRFLACREALGRTPQAADPRRRSEDERPAQDAQATAAAARAFADRLRNKMVGVAA